MGYSCSLADGPFTHTCIFTQDVLLDLQREIQSHETSKQRLKEKEVELLVVKRQVSYHGYRIAENAKPPSYLKEI